MSNPTIATPITTWAELRSSDREVLDRAEVAVLLALDPRTVDHAIAAGTIPAAASQPTTRLSAELTLLRADLIRKIPHSVRRA